MQLRTQNALRAEFFVCAGKGGLCKCLANERRAKCVRAVPSEAYFMKNASEMRRALIDAMRRSRQQQGLQRVEPLP